MITFELYIKNKVTGIYEQTGGTVTPLSAEDLLDEELDQAFIVLSNSTIESILPTTEVKVVIHQGGEADVEKYYIVGSDESTEIPFNDGGKFYNHKLNLVERTKLLEGVICQSLTFTNILGKTWGNGSVESPLPADIFYEASGASNADFASVRNYLKGLYETPIVSGSRLTVYSIDTVVKEVKSLLESELAGIIGIMNDNSLTGDVDGTTITQEATPSLSTPDESYIVNNLARLSYHIVLRHNYSSVGVNYEYNVEYVIHGVENKYPTKPWTITSGIKRILDLAEPIYSLETPRFELNPMQAQKWENTPLPETTMTQCTLREQVQHIGNYIHAQARLGGYYNGEYRENMIFFDEYGNQEQSTLQGKPYVANQIRHSINEYNTKIETNAQNIVNTLDYADGVITTPDSLNFKTLRTENINIRLSESNCIIETELPIYDIISVKVKAYSGDGDAIWIDSNGDGIWDITPFIFEAHEYNNLTSYGGAYPYAKEYALYYTQGQKNLDGLFVKATKEVGGIFGEYFVAYSIVNILESVAPSIDWASKVTSGFPLLSFQVSYIPFYETKYSHTDGYILGEERKQPFTKIYNQSENVIETRFYGENIKGVAQRLGNKESTRTYILGHINDVPKIGTKLDGYYISQVVTEYMPLSIKCTVGLTENFNRLSQNVGINSTKRVAEISEKQAYDRNILIKEYICIGDETPLPLKADKCQYRTEYVTTYMLTGENMSQNLNDDDYDVQTVAVTSFCYKNNVNIDSAISTIKTPVVSSAFGNCITFSWNMKDNYSAGTEVVELDNGYWQKDVPYGDYYGRAYYMYFDLYKDIPQDTGKSAAMTCVAYKDYDGHPRGDIIRNIDAYKLRKDSREIVKMNFAIEYVTNRQDLIIGSALAYCNPLVSSSKKGIVPRVYFFADKTTNFDNVQGRTIIDIKGLEAIDNKSFYFRLTTRNFGSWVIAYPVEETTIKVYDEDTNQEETITQYSGGEILIACNNSSEYYEANGITEETLYIKKYSDRNKDYESA